MKAYIVVKYDRFPWFLLHEVEDTGEAYELANGVSWPYSKPIARLTFKQYQAAEHLTRDLKLEKRRSDEDFDKRADELLDDIVERGNQ